MTHAAETSAIIRLHFPAPVSGTCVIPIWDRIRLVPDSGAAWAALRGGAAAPVPSALPSSHISKYSYALYKDMPCLFCPLCK